MATAALVLLLVVLVVLALLAVPVSVDYRLGWREQFHGRAVLVWLFGLVRVPLQPGGRGARPDEPAAAPSPPKPKQTAKKFNPLRALREKAFRQRVLRFGRELWRALRKRDLYLRVRVGLGDPADTGRLWALCGPLSGWLASLDEASIELEPVFADAVLEVDSSGRFSVIPLQLLYLALGLLCSPPFWRGLRRMRRAA